MSITKRVGSYIIVASPLLLGACDQVRGLSPTSDDKKPGNKLQRTTRAA